MRGYEYHYQGLRSIPSQPFLPLLKEKYFILIRYKRKRATITPLLLKTHTHFFTFIRKYFHFSLLITYFFCIFAPK